MTKVTIIVQNGFVTRVLGNDPDNIEVDVIDLDAQTEDAKEYAQYCLGEAEKELTDIY